MEIALIRYIAQNVSTSTSYCNGNNNLKVSQTECTNLQQNILMNTNPNNYLEANYKTKL